MTKKTSLAAALYIFFTAFAVQAQETAPASQQKHLLLLNTTIGAAYPYGTIEGDGGQSAHPGLAFSINGGYAYCLLPEYFVIGSIGWSRQDLIVSKKILGSEAQKTVHATYLDLSLGGRRTIGRWYADAGIAYGVRLPAWTQEYELAGSTQETTLDGPRESWGANAFILYVGGGYSYTVSEKADITAGVRLAASLNAVYNHEDTLRFMSLQLTLGGGYRL